MPKYLSILFRLPVKPDRGGHPGLEDLACLAQGRLEADRRGPVIEHVLKCSRCYDLLEHTLAELELDQLSEMRKAKGIRWPGLAVAASIMVALVGVGIFYDLPQEKRNMGPPLTYHEMKVAAEPLDATENRSAAVRDSEKDESEKTARPGKTLTEQSIGRRPVLKAQAPAPAPVPPSAVTASPLIATQKVSPAKQPAEAATGRSLPKDGSARVLTKARPAGKAPPQPPHGITLHLRIDPEIMALLRENQSRVWVGEKRIERFLAKIREIKAAPVIPAKISWAGPYPDDLLRNGSPGSLIITVENGEAFLSLTGK